MIQIRLVRPVSHGAVPGSDKFPVPSQVVLSGASKTLASGWVHAGTDATGAIWTIPAADLDMTPPGDVVFFVDSNGKLKVTFGDVSPVAPDPTRFFIHVEASDRFAI